MANQKPKDLRMGLIQAYTVTRGHLRYLLSDLSPEQAVSEPVLGSRSILYYLHHIINSEIYWISATGRSVDVYVKEVPFDVAKDMLDEVQETILSELKSCSEDEFVFRPPTEKEKPSLGWVISHITLHSFYHCAELIYTRYSVGGSDLPNDELEESWMRMIDSISKLIFFVKQKEK
ncbi:MAG: DinB family protein [Promethearchaeota archaeon]